MQILFNINQTAALRAGIDAPHSTQIIEVDPAKLTQEQRDALAETLVDGHKAIACLSAPLGVIVKITLDAPSPDAVAPAIDRAIAQRATHIASARQKELDAQSRRDAELLDAAARTEKKTIKVGIHRDGSFGEGLYSTMPAMDVEYDAVPYVSRLSPASPDALDAYAAAERESEARKRAAIESALPALRAELEAVLAAEEAERAEYAALYARLPAALRERDADGFADKNEILRAIKNLIRSDAGYTAPHRGWKQCSKLTVLTDEEHAALKAVRATAPPDATVEPCELYDSLYRKAAEEDDPEDVDDDGEVYDPVNLRRSAVVTWSRGGVETKAEVPLV